MPTKKSQNKTFFCHFCKSPEVSEILNFGSVGLAGAFLTPEQFSREVHYPLSLHFCHQCYAVQVKEVIPPDILFKNYFYFSSSIGTLRDHFKAYADEIAGLCPNKENSMVLEFGCNDGVLLNPLSTYNFQRIIGVDPAVNVISTINNPKITVVNDFFTELTAKNIKERFGQADIILANNVFAHIPDIQGVTRSVDLLMKPDGTFIFEVHYLGSVIELKQYDMIYHEHLYYYSLISAQKHFGKFGMRIFDVKFVPTHAGSVRFYVCRENSTKQARSQAVKLLESQELSLGYDKFERFSQFAENIYKTKTDLMQLLTVLRSKGNRIAGYGASGRANTIIQYCGITQEHLDYMIDDAPAKWGFYTPGSHFQIRGRDVLDGDKPPDYILVFAWAFFDEICRRNAEYLQKGGRMILPLPQISIYPPEAL